MARLLGSDHFSLAGLVALLVAGGVAAQTAKEMDRTDLAKRIEEHYFDAGQRHLQLGSWCRKQGLVAQGTTHFLRAVEVSQGKNQGAQQVLMLMRGYGDRFWRGTRKKPSKGLLANYQLKARTIETQARREKLAIAQAAFRMGFLEEAKRFFGELIATSEVPLQLDAKGRIPLENGHVPAELAAEVAGKLVELNGKQVVRDAALGRVPEVEALHETATPALVLRSDLGPERGAEIHALAAALLPILEAELAGSPSRRLSLLVFAKRADYEAYLKASGHGSHTAARGLCDYGAFATIVCAEELEAPDLHALVLHELTHLFWFGTTPAVMPDWYAEGFAETFGGQGTFTWDGKQLVPCGLLRTDRIVDLQGAPMPLREFFQGDAIALLTQDRPRGHRFYAQGWAFLRFLRTAAPKEMRERFETWEDMCRGAAAGAVPGQISHNTSDAQQRFETLFEKDLDELERAFLAWLRELRGV